MACSSSCISPTRSQAHCGVCHETFSGISYFDEHRRALEHAQRRSGCADPSLAGKLVRERGVWATPEGHAAVERKVAAMHKARQA